jgi:hypothetical protein
MATLLRYQPLAEDCIRGLYLGGALMGGIFVDEPCLTFSSTMMPIAMPSHTHGKVEAPTLPIVRNGQQLLFTSPQDGALQELQVAGLPCSVSSGTVCIKQSTGNQ